MPSKMKLITIASTVYASSVAVSISILACIISKPIVLDAYAITSAAITTFTVSDITLCILLIKFDATLGKYMVFSTSIFLTLNTFAISSVFSSTDVSASLNDEYNSGNAIKKPIKIGVSSLSSHNIDSSITAIVGAERKMVIMGDKILCNGLKNVVVTLRINATTTDNKNANKVFSRVPDSATQVEF